MAALRELSPQDERLGGAEWNFEVVFKLFIFSLEIEDS
jgi:hypothetical protein